MKILNYMSYYQILRGIRNNKEDKTINNDSDNKTNPFGIFYNFQAINSIAFMSRKPIKYPPFYVVSKDCSIVKDKQGNPIEFTSTPQVKEQLGLTSSEQNTVNAIFDKDKPYKTFSHDGVRYTCVLKDDVTRDGKIDDKLLESRVDEAFTHYGNTRFRPSFYVVNKDCSIVKDKQGNPIEFTSAPQVKEQLGLTLSELISLDTIFNKNSRQRTFSHDGVRYTCILKDRVTDSDGLIDDSMLKSEVEKMFGKKTQKGKILF